MTPDKQRVAIAEACGWVFVKGDKSKDWVAEHDDYWRSPKAFIRGSNPPASMWYGSAERALPDYLTDLNACADMENELKTAGTWMKYVKELGLIFMRDLNGKGTWELHLQRSEDALANGVINFVRATAAQRCEAFLRTIGKWEDAS